MDRKEEIREQLGLLQKELYTLLDKDRQEKNKLLIGKYYKGFEDVSHSYNIFISIVEINKYGVAYFRGVQ